MEKKEVWERVLTREMGREFREREERVERDESLGERVEIVERMREMRESGEKIIYIKQKLVKWRKVHLTLFLYISI